MHPILRLRSYEQKCPTMEKTTREDDTQQLKNVEELRRRDNGFIHQVKEELKEVAGLAR